MESMGYPIYSGSKPICNRPPPSLKPGLGGQNREAHSALRWSRPPGLVDKNALVRDGG